MARCVCCVDLGTTGFKAAAFDDDGVPVREAAVPAPPFLRGAPELDARAVHAGALRCLAGLSDGGAPGSVEALVVTGQRATVVPVDAAGDAVGPVLSWQDTRGARAGQERIGRIGPGRFSRITGLPPSALWSLAKIAWLQRERPEVARAAGRYVLLVDHVLSHLGGRPPVTDPSAASVTGLLDLARGDWSAELLDAAGLAAHEVPELAAAGTVVGRLTAAAAAATGLPEGLPLVLGGGDQQCSALGVGVIDPGQAALGLGTAAVVSCPVDRPPVGDEGAGWFGTAHVIPGRWVIEAIHNTYGATLAWCRDLLAVDSVSSLERLAAEAPAGAGGLLLLPFLSGIGSPDFAGAVRGAILGIDTASGRAELARAALEGVALELRRILDAVADQVAVERLAVSGGGAAPGLATRLLAVAPRRCGEPIRTTERYRRSCCSTTLGVILGLVQELSGDLEITEGLVALGALAAAGDRLGGHDGRDGGGRGRAGEGVRLSDDGVPG